MNRFSMTFLLILSLIVSTFAQKQAHLCSESKIQHFNTLGKFQNVQYPGDETIDVTYYKLMYH